MESGRVDERARWGGRREPSPSQVHRASRTRRAVPVVPAVGTAHAAPGCSIRPVATAVADEGPGKEIGQALVVLATLLAARPMAVVLHAVDRLGALSIVTRFVCMAQLPDPATAQLGLSPPYTFCKK